MYCINIKRVLLIYLYVNVTKLMITLTVLVFEVNDNKDLRYMIL